MIRIFVEGVTDIKFLSDVIQIHFGKNLDLSEIIVTKGWGGLYSEENLNVLQFIQDQGGSNLVIFDTDKSSESIEESYILRRNELFNKANEKNILIDLFLYPNNHDDGDRETLIQQIANPRVYIPFSNCYDPYFECLQKYNESYKNETGNSLKIWPEKERRKLALRNFLSLHGQKADEDKRNYSNPDFWDLNNSKLTPLLDFLRPYFL